MGGHSFCRNAGLSRSFILERDQGVLDGLLLAPVDRSAIYFGKMIGNVLFISLVEIFILPFFIVLFVNSVIRNVLEAKPIAVYLMYSMVYRF